MRLVVLSAAAIAAVWLMIPNQYNLKEVLPSVTAFVDTARAGSLPSYIQKDYPWLQSPSELSTETLTGGYYVGSDYVKYSLPIATSMTMLAWSLVSDGAMSWLIFDRLRSASLPVFGLVDTSQIL